MKRTILKILLVLLVLLGVVFALGPTEKVDLKAAFMPEAIGSDIDTYLAKAEADVANIKPGAQKQMVWLDPATKAKQPYSIVYLHGFSATLAEIKPVPEMIAQKLGANLFYTRLTGHGRDGGAMAQATVNDWVNDVAEALAVGRATGEKVIIVATSTGGTLATIAATMPEIVKDVAGMVMVSPNYAVQAAGSEVLSLPWARQILPKIFGEERSWEPKNEQQGQWWSTKYPNVALLPMQASVNTANAVEFEEISIPALFIFHNDDQVVKSEVTREVAARWGKNTGAKSEIFEVKSSDDPSNHVIAGDILSPQNNQPLADKASAWIMSQ